MSNFIRAALMASTPVLFATDEAVAGDAETGKRSIVPPKYAGKYKGGGSDDLARFINEQCTGSDGFEYTAFFQLCRVNGIAEDKVAHYESQIAEKLHGAQGRARMTLRNMLATFARRNGKLLGLDGNEHEIDIPKPAPSGARRAKNNAEGSEASAGEESGVEE